MDPLPQIRRLFEQFRFSNLFEFWSWWGTWRRSRPFWAGLLTLIGGLTILLLPAGQYTVLTLPGVAGLAGFVLGALIAVLGLFVWFQPDQHSMLGVIIVLLALSSFLYTNFGGFLLGMLFSLLGGCLAFAWSATDKSQTRMQSPKSYDHSETESG